MDYLEEALRRLTAFEGSVAWMYLDTVGKVTVGVGRMLPNVEAAYALPFRRGTDLAAREVVEAEFQRVSAMEKGKLPRFYASANPLTLDAATIEDTLRVVVLGFEEKLRAALPGYDRFPDCAKLALLDMAYNLGPAGLLRGYPTLVGAVAAGDWVKAAATCGRRGPAPARNAWTRAQFLAASTVPTIQASLESLGFRLGRLLWWAPRWALRVFAG